MLDAPETRPRHYILKLDGLTNAMSRLHKYTIGKEKLRLMTQLRIMDDGKSKLSVTVNVNYFAAFNSTASGISWLTFGISCLTQRCVVVGFCLFVVVVVVWRFFFFFFFLRLTLPTVRLTHRKAPRLTDVLKFERDEKKKNNFYFLFF